MTDEEFLKTAPPPVTPEGVTAPPPADTVDEPIPDEGEVEEQPHQEEEQGADPVEPVVPGSEDEGTPPTEPGEEVAAAAPVVEAPVDYAAKMQEALAPLKANGKMLNIQTVDELRQLAQKGANYTRNMQVIAPHRRILTMLENNGLLDEDKLSLLIDVERKDPAAVAKFIKESGIDPLDIDTSTESAYQGGNHRVTDSELAFRTALEDLQSTEGGSETISHINTTWDKASKEELWGNPEVMASINTQRENGIYARIQEEIERQSALGQIPAGTPFLTAYVHVGNALNAQGAFANLGANQNTGARQETAPIATRVVAPKAAVVNGAAAQAAAPTRQTSRRMLSVASLENLNDEDFLKAWAARP